MPAPLPTSVDELEALYVDLEQTGSKWHLETRKLEKELLARVKAKLAEREQDRLRFVKFKGDVFHALRAARTTADQLDAQAHDEASHAEAEKIAAEGLGDGPIDPPPAETLIDEGPFSGYSDQVIAALVDQNVETLKALPDAKPPESRAEAIALLRRAGITPPAVTGAVVTVPDPIDAPPPTPVEPPAEAATAETANRRVRKGK
jgi:hypothetical protein